MIMQVVILAGGIGTRLRPLTYDAPKPMLGINKKPFLEYLIIYLKKQGLNKILICTGYMSDKIISYFKDGSKFGVNIQYSDEGNPIGTGGALKNAESMLEEEFILLNGDTFMPLDYNELMNYYSSANDKNVIVVNKNENSRGNITIDNEKNVLEYDENKKNLEHMDCGVQIFKKRVLEFTPKNKKFSWENEIFPLLIKKKDLIAYETNINFFDIGTFGGVEKFKNKIHTYF